MPAGRGKAKIDGAQYYAQVIYVVRDPLDTFWSHYNFVPNTCNVSTDQLPIEQYYFGYYRSTQLMNEPTYWDYLLSYWQQRDNPRLLWLHYEQMKRDL